MGKNTAYAEDEAPHYDAFISYSHAELDSFAARKLHRKLEHYRIPARLRRDGAKRLKVFRDKEELALSFAGFAVYKNMQISEQYQLSQQNLARYLSSEALRSYQRNDNFRYSPDFTVELDDNITAVIAYSLCEKNQPIIFQKNPPVQNQITPLENVLKSKMLFSLLSFSLLYTLAFSTFFMFFVYL